MPVIVPFSCCLHMIAHSGRSNQVFSRSMPGTTEERHDLRGCALTYAHAVIEKPSTCRCL